MPLIRFEFGAFFFVKPKSMKTIEDLKKTVYTSKEIINDLGQRERIKVPIEMKRHIKTVQGGARFGHYIIDFIIIYALIYGFARSGVFYDLNISFFEFNIGNVRYAWNMSGLLILLLYYTVSEAALGRTLGKFATNSYVIDQYGNKPEFGTIFIRSLSRWIPFYAFSCLGERGWHDKISKTYVVTKTEWESIKKDLAADSGFSDDSDILDA